MLLKTRAVRGHKLLAQNTLPEFGRPLAMFAAAEYANCTVELSELRRRLGYRATDAPNTFNLAIRDLSVGLAFDDFGIGRDPLQELVNAPLNYVKLDRSPVKNINEQSPVHPTVLWGLVGMLREIGCRIVAVELKTCEDAEAYHQLQIDFVLGYYFGRPAAIS